MKTSTCKTIPAAVVPTVAALSTLFIAIPCAVAQVFPSLQAPHTECVLGPGETATVQRYWPAAGTTVASGDTRCSTDGIGRHLCSLSGWLYTPKSAHATNHATLIFNHGSGDSPPEACTMIQYFVARGFVVFTPFRRGTTSQSGGFTNTGETEGAYLTRQKQNWLANHTAYDTVPGDVVQDFKVAYNAAAVAEVKSAIAFAVTQPHVDFARMAIAGHSFGGMITLFAASQLLTPPPRAAVVLSGSVLSWDAHLEQLLTPVAAQHIGPILFTQTVNEGPVTDPTAPTLKQFEAAEGVVGSREVEAAIFSRVPGAVWGQDAHVKFMLDEAQVQRWAPVVEDFLARHGVK